MAKKQATCPICGKAASTNYPPFCSLRCADIDLGKWFRGDYAVEAVELDDIDEGDLEDPELN
ncbi:MAG: DNA gyrase inhibitor YacG [Rickettsiales bacterium]|nr:DNA gyrase inhibitor YacG [Rickettsiales bacterium]